MKIVVVILSVLLTACGSNTIKNSEPIAPLTGGAYELGGRFMDALVSNDEEKAYRLVDKRWHEQATLSQFKALHSFLESIQGNILSYKKDTQLKKERILSHLGIEDRYVLMYPIVTSKKAENMYLKVAFSDKSNSATVVGYDFMEKLTNGKK